MILFFINIGFKHFIVKQFDGEDIFIEFERKRDITDNTWKRMVRFVVQKIIHENDYWPTAGDS